jgi:putative heme-binding domain-containing protein
LQAGLLGEYFDTSDQAPGYLEFSAIRFAGPLLKVALDVTQPTEARLEAVAAAARQVTEIEPELFEFLLGCIAPEQGPLIKMTATICLSQIPLNDSQLLALSKLVPSAGPLKLTRLLMAYGHSHSMEVGHGLVSALAQSSALQSLRADSLKEALRNYPAEILESAEPIMKKLSVNLEKQRAHLAELQPLLIGGSVPRGRELFFNKGTCFACHTVNGLGGHIGPDLSKVGSIRADNDLLEAIVYPSASFARGFEPILITTKDEEVHSGMISRETADAIYFYDSARVEMRLLRSAVKEIRPGNVSIMPEGLETLLGPEGIRDVVAFLGSLR